MSEQRILLISYHFPPSAAVGGQRIANFARCLSGLGWEPHVLTIEDRSIEQVDKGRLNALDSVRIHKARVLPTALAIWMAANGRARRFFGGSTRPQPAQGAPASVPGSSARRETAIRRLRRYILSFLILPDYERGWILPAFETAVRLVRRHRIDWILTSCPPYSAHLIGLAVRMVTGAKWIADFRDPWMTAEYKQLFPTSALSLRIESWLERRVVERADLVVFNVERLRKAYRDRYAHVPAAKFAFIPNGLPMAALTERSLPKYGAFTITYTGGLYAGRSPEPVFQAVSRLIRDGRVAPGAIRIRLIGQCGSIEGVPMSTVIRNNELKAVVTVEDAIPYTEALTVVGKSHLALLLAPGLPFQVPAKFYDYLATGTRILAIAEDGATADVVKQTASGMAFPPLDVDGMARFIHDELTSPPATNGSRELALARLDSRKVTADLIDHLNGTAVPGNEVAWQA